MDAVDTWLSTYPASPVILDVLGTLDPDEIRAVARRYEPETEEVFFFAASVGALFGVRRHDGSRVAIKVNTLFRDPTYFAEVQRLQSALSAAGFPAPAPVRRAGTVTVDEWLDEGAFRDGHEPEVRRALARSLHEFVELATATGIRPRREFLRPADALWPKPHNALFDFEATAAGAGWIDEIACVARAVPAAGGEVVGHSDWAAKHVRFDTALRPTAVYDWDSVDTELETRSVGGAAGSFTYTEELSQPVGRWPSPEESAAFVADYEEARGEPFSAPEYRAVTAARVYLLAYAARCHHAVGGDTRDQRLEEHAAALP
ncbi:MAG TPA: hypothetical protein VFU56_07415 [Gaiellaceae bacterium]|nr:hypothetical protein [Gaiellaceae bacterium]